MMPKNPNTAGIYIHIPFCHARCGYCDFVTFTGKEDRVDSYVQALRNEIDLYADPSLSVPTVFFGGGTPSLLEPSHVSHILQSIRASFALWPDAEITMEANPESLTGKKAQGWKAAVVNRLSIGLQAFDNRLLKAMDRLHTVEEFLAAYQTARSAGFENVNVDLIYGFPGQSLLDWQDTVRKTIALNPEHLSLYALKVEEHTPFHAQGIRVDDDLQADMYEWAIPFLKASGYPQYEISNFAKPGYECRHNLIYWRQQDYLGLGAGAVGCVAGTRWENHKNLPDYLNAVESNSLPVLSRELLTPETRRFERLMLGLRLREGLVWAEEPRMDWRSEREHLASRHLLEEIQPGHWRIPDSAIALTNQILLSFI